MRILAFTVVVFAFLLGLTTMASAAPARGKYFDRVIFVLFENTDYKDAIAQPFFSQLARSGANFTNFLAETHPSQGNYIALTSGSLNGVHSDSPVDLNVNHVGDLLDAKGITWRVYAEGYPGNCYKGASKNGYARKHNPFISYLNVQRDAARCANIVDASQFDRDLAANQLPQYVFYIPDERNDGHDTSVSFADRWYQQRFGAFVADANFMNGTLLVSTFDESGGYFGKNQIYTTLFGPMIAAGGSFSSTFNHYSLLQMVEENWALGNLGKEDVTAQAFPSAVWK